MSNAKPSFSSPSDLWQKVKDAGFNPEEVIVDISRTPLESLWGCKSVDYGEPPKPHNCIAFGEDVPTPWGYLPQVILLIRSDVYEKLGELAHPQPVPEQPKKPRIKASDLFPKDWKPKPGFTDPRIDMDVSEFTNRKK